MNSAYILALLALSGCAAMQRATSHDGMTPEERQDYSNTQEIMRQNEAIEKKSVLRQNEDMNTVIRQWGEPDETELAKGLLIYWYENDGDPTFLVFENNKLVGWRRDRETIELRRRIAYEEEASRRQRIGDALRGLGEGIKRATQPPPDATIEIRNR